MASTVTIFVNEYVNIPFINGIQVDFVVDIIDQISNCDGHLNGLSHHYC